MIELVDSGCPRDTAHEVLRGASMEAIANGEELIDVCSRIPEITSRFTVEEIEVMFEPRSHLGVTQQIIDNAVSVANKYLNES